LSILERTKDVKNETILKIEPFQSTSRLCSYFPYVEFTKKDFVGGCNKRNENEPLILERNYAMQKKKHETKEDEVLSSLYDKDDIIFISKPSFSFPFVKPPNMIPNVDETLLWNEYGPDNDEQNKPNAQPLWVKRMDKKLSKKPSTFYQFTDNIVEDIMSESFASMMSHEKLRD